MGRIKATSEKIAKKVGLRRVRGNNITRMKKRRNSRRFLTQSFNRRPEATQSRRRGQTAEELSFERSNVRESLVTERTIGRPVKRGVRRFSTFGEKVATFDARQKRAGRMRRSTHKFARNRKVNDL